MPSKHEHYKCYHGGFSSFCLQVRFSFDGESFWAPVQCPFERGINEGSVEGKKEGSTLAAPEPKKELDWQDITIHRDGGLVKPA